MALSNVKHEMPMDMQELYESGVKYFHFYGDAISVGQIQPLGEWQQCLKTRFREKRVYNVLQRTSELYGSFLLDHGAIVTTARTHERKLARNPAFAPVPSPSREPAATNPALNSIRKPVLTPEQPPVLEPAPDPSREPCLNPIPRNTLKPTQEPALEPIWGQRSNRLASLRALDNSPYTILKPSKHLEDFVSLIFVR
ncbi:hypothetical protein PV325_013309 [Microctonus aethiopoides]|nr:hypothetical protein PV325_013309 [Microctonus aethiopoides]